MLFMSSDPNLFFYFTIFLIHTISHFKFFEKTGFIGVPAMLRPERPNTKKGWRHVGRSISL